MRRWCRTWGGGQASRPWARSASVSIPKGKRYCYTRVGAYLPSIGSLFDPVLVSNDASLHLLLTDFDDLQLEFSSLPLELVPLAGGHLFVGGGAP